LFVIGVQDQQLIERALSNRVDLKLFARPSMFSRLPV
jgi:hypothetical protein